MAKMTTTSGRYMTDEEICYRFSQMERNRKSAEILAQLNAIPLVTIINILVSNDMYPTEKPKSSRKAKAPREKYHHWTDKEVYEVVTSYANGEDFASLGARFGVSEKAIKALLKRNAGIF